MSLTPVKIKQLIVYQPVSLLGDTKMSFNDITYDIEFRDTYFFIRHKTSKLHVCVHSSNVSQFTLLEDIPQEPIKAPTRGLRVVPKTNTQDSPTIQC